MTGSPSPANPSRSDAAWEQPLIENLAMTSSGDTYVLLYSGGWWESAGYAIGYATCDTPLGPCTKNTIDRWCPVPGVDAQRASVPSKSLQLTKGPTPVARRVSPTERIRAEIDVLFASERDLASTLEDVARLTARLVMQTAIEAEVDEFLGRAATSVESTTIGQGAATASSRQRR